MPYQNLSTGRRVSVRGKEGVIREEGDKCKVKFDDGSFGFFDSTEVTPVNVESTLKGKYARMKAEGKLEDVMMPPTATGEDPLAQPKRKTGRGIGEDQTVLGKAVSGDVFVKSAEEAFGKPFAGYDNFADCVDKNQNKGDPEAYCASIKQQVEGKEAGIKKDPNIGRVGRCPECGKILSEDDAYGHDCEVGIGKAGKKEPPFISYPTGESDSLQEYLDRPEGARARARAQKGMVDDVMAWEDGSMSEAEETKFFQHLVDTGQAWTLQGMYGRRATELIREGKVKKR